MSENLDLVRSIYADWERGDYGSAEWAHPNIELIVADGPSPGRWEGLPAMAASARDLFSVWEDLRAEAEQYRALASWCSIIAPDTGRPAAWSLRTCQHRVGPSGTCAMAR